MHFLVFFLEKRCEELATPGVSQSAQVGEAQVVKFPRFAQ